MSETTGIVTAVLSFLGACFTGYMAYLMAKLKVQQDEAAKKVEVVAVKQATADAKADKVAVRVEAVKDAVAKATAATVDQLATIAATGEKTHTLVNSNMAVQLKLNAELSRWKAEQMKDVGGAEAADAEAAALKAEQMFTEHQGKQILVDANVRTSGPPPLPNRP